MRKPTLFTVLILLALPALPAFAMNPEKLVQISQSIVMVRGYNANGGLTFGSGVVVSAHNVVTNCHVIRSSSKPWIARGEETYQIESVRADRWHDLCLLTASDLPLNPVSIASSENFKRGQEVYSIGHSNGVPNPLTSVGTISATYAFDGGKVIRSNARFMMGASGSGIFDYEGHLLGINCFKSPGRPAYFYSLPVKWLTKLEKLPVETSFPIAGKTFWEEEEEKKPFFMQVVIPELKQDWPKLERIALAWTVAEPQNSDAWFELGTAQENLSKLQEARVSYQQSVSLDPTNTDSLFRLGVFAKRDGDKATVIRIKLTINNISSDLAKEYSTLLGCDLEC